ncbi:MAG: hypothetical protein ACLVL7_08935 [Anaerotruncus massiliensis (ex Togo et al. 2019)]
MHEKEHPGIAEVRSKGNSQVLAEAFAAAAREKGHETEVLRVSGMKIAGCSVRALLEKGRHALRPADDMQKLYPKLTVT